MNIHEYQAKAVLREFGVPVPRGHAAFSVEEAVKAAQAARRPRLVVKAQIHAGGRGKARRRRRGVRSVEDVTQARPSGCSASAGHAPDRPARQGGQPPLHRGRLRHRPRVLSLRARRPRDLARRLRRLDRGRHGHRGGRAHDAREDRHLPRRSRDRHHAAPRPRASPRPRAHGDLAKQARDAVSASSTRPSSPRT